MYCKSPVFLFAQIIKGDGLLAADFGGKSDPYAVIYVGNKQIHKTGLERQTLNPLWNESFKWVGQERTPELRIEIWDWDKFSADDFLGMAVVKLGPLLQNGKSARGDTLNLTLTPRDGKKEKITGTIDVKIKFAELYTCLHESISTNSLNEIKYLLDEADKEPDHNKKYCLADCLQIAIQEDSNGIGEWLIDRGAPFEKVDLFNLHSTKSAFTIAYEHRRVEFGKLLVKKGGDPSELIRNYRATHDPILREYLRTVGVDFE